MNIKKRYNQKYFDWYKKIGKFGAIFNKKNFLPYINKKDVVLDFGCGAGYLLNSIDCKVKYGVEINPIAIKEAKANKIRIFKNSNKLPNNTFDVIISNQVLQHCAQPKLELMNLYNSLKKGGKIIFYVACSGIDLKYKKDDINFQLYSWSPMNLGNLFRSCDFKIIETKIRFFRWPPKYELIYNMFGVSIFNFLSFCYGYFYRNKISLCMIVAKK
jgi:SAM-dependent methyltransferase